MLRFCYIDMMKRTQSAAIPYRRNAARELELLLVTSRQKGRWVFPKGNVRGMLPHASAAREAFEEAGVLGVVSRKPVGCYHQIKTTAGDMSIAVPVMAYPLFVNTLLQTWPEMTMRQRKWMHVQEAADAVDDPDLRAIIEIFAVKYWNADLVE